jgi:hypothetical protein
MNYKSIVWLASYPKSGNTWVRCFLDAYFLGEVDINEMVCSISDDSAARQVIEHESDPSKYPIDIQMLTRPVGMLRLVREYENSKIPGIPLFVKTHNAHMVANGIELLPQALTHSVIHIVRDPRDVVVSFAKHMGVDIGKAMEYFFDKYRTLVDERKPKMADFISSWPDNVKSYLNADSHNVLTVRYEDMKADPVTEFKRILEHSGVEPDVDRIRTALEKVELSKLRKQESEKGFNESSPHAKNSFFGKGETGGWKGKLTHAQEHRILKKCESVMKRLGYLKSKAA